MDHICIRDPLTIVNVYPQRKFPGRLTELSKALSIEVNWFNNLETIAV